MFVLAHLLAVILVVPTSAGSLVRWKRIWTVTELVQRAPVHTTASGYCVHTWSLPPARCHLSAMKWAAVRLLCACMSKHSVGDVLQKHTADPKSSTDVGAPRCSKWTSKMEVQERGSVSTELSEQCNNIKKKIKVALSPPQMNRYLHKSLTVGTIQHYSKN